MKYIFNFSILGISEKGIIPLFESKSEIFQHYELDYLECNITEPDESTNIVGYVRIKDSKVFKNHFVAVLEFEHQWGHFKFVDQSIIDKLMSKYSIDYILFNDCYNLILSR